MVDVDKILEQEDFREVHAALEHVRLPQCPIGVPLHE